MACGTVTPMPEPQDSHADLATAIDQAHEAIASVRDDQLDDPTPCDAWDVGRLVAHLAVGAGHLLEQARGGSPDWDAVPDRVDDAAAMFSANAAALLAHVRDAGASADWQCAELAVHTWDLVTATGQSPDLDPAPAERGLAFMARMLSPQLRGDAFGPEREAPEGASAHARIAAFAGRDVSAAYR